MPDVRTKWNFHARWNQSEQFWQEDFRQLAGCGFDLLRWQMPWSMVEPKPGEYRWDLIDPKVELATKLGLEVFYPIVHFNYPSWIAGRGVRHAVLSKELGDRVAEYTDKVLSRYHFRLVIPIVEVQMDACQRALLGNWQPHLKSRWAYPMVHRNLVAAFKQGAAVAKSHGCTVFCSEPASEIQTVLELRDSIDVAGIDLYPHMHNSWSILEYLQQWWEAALVPLCISEFGTPETYDPSTKVDHYNKFIEAGVDRHRVMQARMLRDTLAAAQKEGIPIPFGGWYPGTGNIGWGFALTKERRKADCDRAGLVDLARQPDGTLKRVLCPQLVAEVMAMRDLGAVRVQPHVQTPAAAAAAMPDPWVNSPVPAAAHATATS